MDEKLEEMEKKKEKLKANFLKRKKILAQHLNSAPFTKFTDQISFLFGVLLTIC